MRYDALNVLPRSAGRTVEPQSYDCVTVFFSDIVGFTDMSATISAHDVLDMLDRLYTVFDKVLAAATPSPFQVHFSFPHDIWTHVFRLVHCRHACVGWELCAAG